MTSSRSQPVLALRGAITDVEGAGALGAALDLLRDYMTAAGATDPRHGQVLIAARMALEMQRVHFPICEKCGAVNADPRSWDPRSEDCPDCEDRA